MKKFSRLRTETKLESDLGTLEPSYERNFQAIHRHPKSASHQRYIQDMMAITNELSGKFSSFTNINTENPVWIECDFILFFRW